MPKKVYKILYAYLVSDHVFCCNLFFSFEILLQFVTDLRQLFCYILFDNMCNFLICIFLLLSTDSISVIFIEFLKAKIEIKVLFSVLQKNDCCVMKSLRNSWSKSKENKESHKKCVEAHAKKILSSTEMDIFLIFPNLIIQYEICRKSYKKISM